MRKLLVVLALMAATALMITACGSPAAAQNGGEEALDEVTVQLSWLPTIEYAGLYMAQDKGYYAQENLDVELLPGGLNETGEAINPLELVLSGDADFGITDGGFLLMAQSQGQDLVAVASIYQRHPLAFASLAESSITRPQDLIGKSIMMDPVTASVGLRALLASQGIGEDEVEIITRDDYTITPLVSGRVDVIDAWLTNEVVSLTEGGYEINTLLISDYGVDMYPNVIFTTRETIESNPDLVERFVRATVLGLQSAVEDPQRSAELSIEFDPSLSETKEAAAMLQSLPLIQPAGSQPGMMESSVWEFTHDTLLEQGLISDPVDISRAFTTDFVNKVYSE